ncbi:hypothetical protein CDAR_66971 [Caerostris darwini]|uniref:Uncharacterized protein n=1 Tax=Caerostris darwini TaxID=1538125 RepID=A0AAV4QUH3_9ARAC|nr:hypothetical protein CDAR_66971 [Caerostris darwini]
MPRKRVWGSSEAVAMTTLLILKSETLVLRKRIKLLMHAVFSVRPIKQQTMQLKKNSLRLVSLTLLSLRVVPPSPPLTPQEHSKNSSFLQSREIS